MKKALLIHFSDSHIRAEDKASWNLKAKKILDSLNIFENLEAIIILFSGDIASSGKLVEYQIASEFIDYIENGLKEQYRNTYIRTLVLPGNHDVDFNMSNLSRGEITESGKNEQEKLSKEYLEKMKNFYLFANKYKCFNENPFLHKAFIKTSNFELRFFLINSAVFSLLNDTKGDNDRGLHYIDREVLSDLQKVDQSQINIASSHHALDYFNDNLSTEIREIFVKNINFVFFGHEHVEIDMKMNIEMSPYIHLNYGIPLNDGKLSGYTCYLLDETNNKIYPYKAIWEPSFNYYNLKTKRSSDITLHNKYNIYIKPNFLEKMKKLDKIISTGRLDNIFVFPNMSYREFKYNKEKKINTFEKFKKAIAEKKLCLIEGEDSTGKTSIAQFLFNEYSINDLPLLIDAYEINIKEYSELLLDTLSHQYKDNFTLSLFKQQKKEKKIALIDDAEKISEDQLNLFIDQCLKDFSKVILFYNGSTEFNIKKIIEERMEQDSSKIRLVISPFLHKKRIELIEKVTQLYNLSYGKEQIKKTAININDFISNQLNIVSLNPDFLLMFLKVYFTEKIDQNNSKIFNNIFQKHIYSLMNGIKNEDYKQNYVYLLQKIAYIMYSNQEYPLKKEDFISVINDYNDEAEEHRNDVNPFDFLNSMIEAKILKYADGKGDIVFFSKNYLSYFAAKEILNQYISSSGDDGEIKKILKYICFGLNSDILLFITYFTDNTNVLNLLYKQANDYFAKLTSEIDFDKNKDTLLLRNNNSFYIEMPTEEKREKAIENLEKQENKANKNNKYLNENICAYDETKINNYYNTIIRGVKYLEIISKILPDFIHIMKGGQISKFVDAVYNYPNKLIAYLIEPYEVIYNLNYDEIEIVFEGEKQSLSEIEFNRLKNVIAESSRVLVLNIYDQSARLIASKNTVKALNYYDYKKNTNSFIFNAMVYENLRDINALGDKLIEISDKNNSKEIDYFLSRILQKHFTYNNYVKEHGKIQMYKDRFMISDKKNINKETTAEFIKKRS